MKTIVLALLLTAAVWGAGVETVYEPTIYSCNGSTKSFTFSWDIWNTSASTHEDLVVILVDSDGDPRTLTENSSGTYGYSVAATNNDFRDGPGGTVTTVTAFASGYQIVLQRATPRTQTNSYGTQSAPTEREVGNSVDRLTLMVQDLAEQVGRALRAPVVDYAEDMNLPAGFGSDVGYTYWNGSAWVLATTGVDIGSLSAAWTDVTDGTTTTLANGRTVRDQLGRPFINVKTDYDADDTGTSESSTEIQAAIDAANTAGGGTIYFPEGTYIADALTLQSNLTLLGDGIGASTIKMKDSATDDLFTATSENYISVRGLTFDLNGSNQGNPSSPASKRGLYFNTSNHVRVQNCHFKGFFEYYIDCYTASDIWIQDCYFTGSVPGTPTEWTSGDLHFTTCSDVRVQNCTMDHATPSDADHAIIGVFLSGVVRGQVTGNHFINCGKDTGGGHQGAAIDFYRDCDDVHVHNNTLESCQYIGCRISRSTNIWISECSIDTSDSGTQEAIQIYADATTDTDRIWVVDCNLMTNDASGECVLVSTNDAAGDEPNDIHIIGNTMTGRYGVHVDTGGYGIEVKDNVIETTYPAIRVDEGGSAAVLSGVVVAGNVCRMQNCADQYAIQVDGDDAVVANNLILDAYNGIALKVASNGLVCGNVIEASNDHLLVYNETQDCDVHGNKYIGAGTVLWNQGSGVIDTVVYARGNKAAAGSVVIGEDSDDGTNTLTLQAQAMTGNVTLTLPADDGDNGEVLTTNGSGVTSWSAAGAGDITAVGDSASGAAFTADGTGNTLHFEGSSADAHETIIQGYDVAADVTFTLPPDDGDAGEQLQTDGSGNLTWEAAGTVSVADDESTDDGHEVVFTTDNTNLESDGNFTYNPSSGTVAATEFSGGGGNLTGVDAATGDSATDFFDAGEIPDDRISDTLTSSTCTGTAAIATAVTITDNESTAENNPLVFVPDGDLDGGNLGLESDGTCYYTPSTGVITTTGFAGALTGNVTGDVTGSSGTCTGEAASVTNATFTTALTVNTGTVTLTGHADNDSALTIGKGAVSVSGTNTGDNTVATSGDAAVDFFGAGVDAVTDATTCTDIEGTKLSITGGTLNCTETDSVVGAVSGIVKADGGGNISAAVAGTDYMAAAKLVDIVCSGTGLSGGADDVLPGTDADVTITLTPDTVAGAITAGSYNNDSIQADDIDTINCGTSCTWDAANDEIDVDDDFLKNDGDSGTGDYDFGGADLELPQGQTPDTDGDIDLDFTDGSVVIQHGSAHAELAASTDVVVGKLIRSFSATLAFPDLLQAEIDNWPLKAIEATEFPHGVVVTDIHIKTSASSTYAINVENWDDPTTINGVNPTIDAITTSSSTEASEDTITYATIAAGQIIMLDLPTTDISWVQIQVEYYEPITSP